MAAARAATLTSALLGQGDSSQVEPGQVDSARQLAHPNRCVVLWAGRLVVITAGGTREALDPVRFLGNRSTGKQGVALAGGGTRPGRDRAPDRCEP